MTLRRRLWAAWQVLRGRPFSIEFAWPIPPPEVQRAQAAEERTRIAALTAPIDPPHRILSIGIDQWQLDGAPFPWATMDDWVLTFGEAQATTLTVTMPVRLAGTTPYEPEAPWSVRAPHMAVPGPDGLCRMWDGVTTCHLPTDAGVHPQPIDDYPTPA